MIKAELLAVCRQLCPKPAYELDRLAEAAGHQILRTPQSLVSGNSGDFSLLKAVGQEGAAALLTSMPLHPLGQMRRHRRLFP
jgi:hypothetical protein